MKKRKLFSINLPIRTSLVILLAIPSKDFRQIQRLKRGLSWKTEACSNDVYMCVLVLWSERKNRSGKLTNTSSSSHPKGTHLGSAAGPVATTVPTVSEDCDKSIDGQHPTSTSGDQDIDQDCISRASSSNDDFVTDEIKVVSVETVSQLTTEADMALSRSVSSEELLPSECLLISDESSRESPAAQLFTDSAALLVSSNSTESSSKFVVQTVPVSNLSPVNIDDLVSKSGGESSL